MALSIEKITKNRFILIVSAVISFGLSFSYIYLIYEPSLESKLVYANAIVLSDEHKKHLIYFFEDSNIYTNQEIKSVLIEDIGIGNCSNIKNKQRFKLNLEGYVASTISLIFIEDKDGVLRHCSSVNPLSKVDIVVE